MFLKLLTLGRIKDVPKQTILKEKQWKGQKHTYLGVVFDSKLNWKENINSVPKKTELEKVLLEKTEILWSQFSFISNFL